MDRIAYVIGSISQIEDINKLASELNSKYEKVFSVTKEETKSIDQLISECFDKIEKSDDIYIVMKEDRSIGTGCLYELEYARRLDKNIFFQYKNLI